MLGLSPAWKGVIQDTASTSTLVALICARERTTGYSLARGGLQAERPSPVYVSAQSHSSVEKAALLAGFGRDNVRNVPCDAQHAICAAAASRSCCGRTSTTGFNRAPSWRPRDNRRYGD